MAVAQELNSVVTNVVDSDISAEMTKSEILLSAQAQIENMLNELRVVDEEVYEAVQWGSQKPDFTIVDVYRASKIVDRALALNNASALDEQLRAIYVLMLIASLPLDAIIYSRLHRIFFNRATTQGEKYHNRKILASIAQLDDALGNSDEFSEKLLRSDLSGIEREIQKLVDRRVKSALTSVSMLTNLLISDHEYLASVSPTVARTKFRQKASSVKVAGRSLNYYVKTFKSAIKDALSRIDDLTEQLKDVRNEKQRRVRELNKELGKAHDMVRSLQQECDPLSDLFGLDINNSKDEEIAKLTLRLEQLETRNTELQRENNRLHKEKAKAEFSDN